MFVLEVFFCFIWGVGGYVRLNRCESVCSQRFPCLCCVPTRTTHPSLMAPLLVNQRVVGMHQHMLGTHRGPNLTSEARETEPSSKGEEKKKEKKKLLFKIFGAQDQTHTPLHKQPHIVCTHLCRAKINISLSDLGLENDRNKTKTTTSTCSQLHRLSSCDHSTSSTLLCRAPCAALVVLIAAHLCMCVSGCLPFCRTTSCWLREAH